MKSIYELERNLELVTRLVQRNDCHETRNLETLALKALILAQDIKSLKWELHFISEDFDNLWTEYHA